MNTYFHQCTANRYGCYSITWVVERWSAKHGRSSQAQHERQTDEAGAHRFCAKHGLTFPVSLPNK